jgi:hypothetical protein
MMLEVRWLYSWHDVPTSVMRNNKLSLTNDEPDEVYETGQVEEVCVLLIDSYHKFVRQLTQQAFDCMCSVCRIVHTVIT